MYCLSNVSLSIISFFPPQTYLQDSQEKKEKAKKEPELPPPPTSTNLNQILDAGQDSLDTLAISGLGLGFRASIPKMPSFKVCKKVTVINMLILEFQRSI